jgi:long-chain acyl-CoA synthetase
MLVVPNFDSLEAWARHKGIANGDRRRWRGSARCARSWSGGDSAAGGFARYELPKKVLPLPREFSLERGEITPSLKVKRRVVEQAYARRSRRCTPSRRRRNRR